MSFSATSSSITTLYSRILDMSINRMVAYGTFARKGSFPADRMAVMILCRLFLYDPLYPGSPGLFPLPLGMDPGGRASFVPYMTRKYFADGTVDNVEDMNFAPPAALAPSTPQFATVLGYPFEFLRRSPNVGS